MAIGFLIFYGIAAAIILGGGFVVFWFLRRRSMVLAVILSLLSVPALVLVWPIPIHGGFMLLGEAILDEWSRDRAQEEHIRVDQKKQEYLDKLGGRFQGELAIVQSHPHSRGWQKIVDAESHTAWLATASGMVWSQWLELTATESLPTLALAKQRCAEFSPAGFWALPTEAEHVHMWLAGGLDVLPTTETGSVSYMVDADFQMEMPVYHVIGGDNSQARGARRFSVHCVARGPSGPERGFIRRDIPLEDWNRYQLFKSL